MKYLLESLIIINRQIKNDIYDELVQLKHLINAKQKEVVKRTEEKEELILRKAKDMHIKFDICQRCKYPYFDNFCPVCKGRGWN